MVDHEDKTVCSVLSVKAAIGINGLIKAAIDLVFQKVKPSTGAASGNYCKASVSGKESIAVANGPESKAKGALGCWLVLSEWNKEGTKILRAKITQVDGKKIKSDTWYSLKGGKFVAEEKEVA